MCGSRLAPTFAAHLSTPVNPLTMKTSKTPRPTRSTLLNRRLNRAVAASQLGNPDGLKLASRRSELPKAHRYDVAIALAGSLLIVLLAFLLAY